MTAVSAFRPMIAGRIAGVTDPQIDRAVVDTAIEFCERSIAVRFMVDSFPTVADQREYTLDPPSGMLVFKAIRVWADSTELVPLGDDALGGPWGHVSSVPGQTTPTGQPRYFVAGEDGTISLFPVPDKAYMINARVATRPTYLTTVLADQLMNEWGETIVNGALSRLYMQPVEGMNLQLASACGTIYGAGTNRALLKASSGVAAAERRVTPVHI